MDDEARVFPSQLAQCWIKAKTEDDEDRCDKLAWAWRTRAAADREVIKMKGMIDDIEKASGPLTWKEFLEGVAKRVKGGNENKYRV